MYGDRYGLNDEIQVTGNSLLSISRIERDSMNFQTSPAHEELRAKVRAFVEA